MYRGDIPPKEAYERLKADPGAVLVDVRTAAEWNYVGIPAVDQLLRVSWQVYPSLELNPSFVAAVEAAGVTKDAQVLCICRSGVRSAHAAAALTAAGFKNCYNVAEGFEGGRDGDGHRGTLGGWKAAGLPWVQG